MVTKVTDPKVRVSLDPKAYEAGAERVSLSTKRMLAAQEAADRKHRAMLSAHGAAIREDQDRQAALAAAVEKAERRKQAALKTTATVAVGAGAALLAGLALASREAMSWQSAWAGVTKTVDGSDAELAQLEDDLRRLALVIPATHEEIAAVAEAAGQLGVQTPAIAGFTRVMLDLGETTNLSADEAAISVAQLMNIMQTAPGEVSNLGAALVALGNNGASTERDIVQMAQRIAGAAATVGMSEADVLSIANAVASVGIEVEAGGSAVSNVIIDIAKAVAAGGDDLRAWADVAGMSAAQFAETWKTAPAAALAAFTTGLGEMNKAGGDVFGTLSDLGESEIRTTRALLSMANAGDLLTDSLQLGSQAWKDNAALAVEATKRYETAESRMQIAKNSIADAAITIGQTFLPMIADAADNVAALVQRVAELPEPVVQVLSVLGGVAGVVGVIGGGLVLALPKVVAFREALRTVRAAALAAESGLGRVALKATSFASKAAGVATAAILLANVLDNIATAGDEAAPGLEKVTQALLEGNDADIYATYGHQAENLAASLNTLLGQGFDQRMDRFGNAINHALGDTLSDGVNDARDALDAQGRALAALVNSGNAERAAAIFDRLAAEAAAAGYSREDLLSTMPAYAEALAAVSNAQETSATSTDTLTTRYNQATSAVEELTDAQLEYLDAVAQSDAAFISLGDAYSSAVAKKQEAAQADADAWNAQAEAAENTAREQGRTLEVARKDWQDFYDGKSVTVEEYLAELQQQVATQQQWEADLLTLAGRGVGQGALDMLRSEGVELAPMVHELASGSDEQLSRLSELAAQGGDDATSAFADKLVSGAPVLQAAGDQLGKAAVDAIVARLMDGQTTLQQIVDEYGLIVAGMGPDLTAQDYSASGGLGLGTATQSWAGVNPDSFRGGGRGGTFRTGAAPSGSSYPRLPSSSSPLVAAAAAAAAGPLVVTVPLNTESRTDASLNFYGPVTFTDPAAASSQNAKAVANTAGRRERVANGRQGGITR